MFLRALLFQGDSTINNHLGVLCWSSTKRPSSSFHWKQFFSPWYSCRTAHFGVKQQSLTHSLYHFAHCVFRIYTTDYDNNVNIIPYIFLYFIKAIRQFRCFSENLLTRETTRWTTQTYIMWRVTTGSVLKISGGFSVRFRNCIFYTGNYFCCLLQNKIFKL